MDISREEFDSYVQKAIDDIDPQFRVHLEEVPVIVEDLPDNVVRADIKLHDPKTLLGIFRGLPLKKRSVHSAGYTNQIILYRQNILACCRTRRQLIRRIRKTIIHELGHHLGFSEQQLRQHHY
jgi:predicted Zn-dependent protease with MMP-like domain